MESSPEKKALNWLQRIFNEKDKENVRLYTFASEEGYAVECSKLMDPSQGRLRDEILLGINGAFTKAAPGISAVAIPLDSVSNQHLFFRKKPLLDPRAQSVMRKSLEVLEMLAQRHVLLLTRPPSKADPEEAPMSPWELLELLGGPEALDLLAGAEKPTLDPKRISLPAIALFDLERATGIKWEQREHLNERYYVTTQPVTDSFATSAKLMSAMGLNGASGEGLPGSSAAHMGDALAGKGMGLIALNAKWVTAAALAKLRACAQKEGSHAEGTLKALFTGPAPDVGRGH